MPSPIRYLVLLLTTACNARCVYCYRNEESAQVMSMDVARTALALAAQSGAPFHVQLAGGEPTLALEAIAMLVRWCATPGGPPPSRCRQMAHASMTR